MRCEFYQNDNLTNDEEKSMMDMKQLKENISNKLNLSVDTDSSTPTSTSAIKETTVAKKVSPVSSSSQPMAIGATIHIKGDVTGNEDLIIHGHVEGAIKLKDYNVIIGPQGRVQANIHAKQIVVEGELNGDLIGEEKVIIRKTGNVLGNVVSPRVTLEDGAMFKGSIEMEPRQSSNQEKYSGNKFDSASAKTNAV